MRSAPERGTRDARYPLRFGTAVSLLIAGTLVLVLYVLPERYVISAGFRESGLTFPTPVTPFLPVPDVPVRAKPVAPGVAVGGVTAGPTDAAGTGIVAAHDADERRLLARTLRDQGRTSEAAEEYARFAAEHPDDVDLLLEWALAHAWAGEHAHAAEILLEALRRSPGSVPVRIELARTYFSLGLVREADATLARIDDATLAATGASALRDGLRAALFIPPVPATARTRVELAAEARAEQDFSRASSLLAEALRDDPDDAQAWQAYADLLEYELADFEGAHAALVEVTRIAGADAERDLRLARLEIWTGRATHATMRLETLLTALDEARSDIDEADATDLSLLRAEAFALLGDLHRWSGDRLRASRHYLLALGEDRTSARAREGLAALDAEVSRQVAQLEVPRRGARVTTLADTDDFARTDLALEWVEVSPAGRVWGGAVGNRWISGVGPSGLDAQRRGLFVELIGARWWRLGTVRTELSAGAEHVRSTWDVSFGAALTHRGQRGGVSEARYAHGPAHSLTNTLQSVSAEVVQDRFTLEHERPLGERGGFASSLDASYLRTAASGSTDPGTTRLQASLTATRSMGASLSLGLTGQALTFVDPAPPAGGATGTGAVVARLFWDPRFVLSAGPLARLDHDVAPDWKLQGRLAPGLALVDERAAPSLELVPHLSVEAGVVYDGARARAAFDLFFYQGQFDGYRSYGMRLTIGALTLPGLGGP